MALSELIDGFRDEFPEFEDDDVYPDSMLNFWAGLGDRLLNVDRWGDLRTDGLKLFVAHNASLAAQNVANAAQGGVPGTGLGLVTSHSVGPVSESMDTQSSMEEGGGNYNLTTYGTTFLRLSRIVGSGGVQIW